MHRHELRTIGFARDTGNAASPSDTGLAVERSKWTIFACRPLRCPVSTFTVPSATSVETIFEIVA
jgi:hypothetical protein